MQKSGNKFVLKPWQILVVDDDRITLALLSSAISDLSHVETATNGQEALLRLENAAPPDLILLDAQMPELDGFEVCSRLKANPQLAAIPVIFVTGHTDQATEIRALQAGAVDFISKPLSLPVVKARVSTQLTLLDQKRALERRIASQSSEIQLLLDSIPDPIWFQNADGVYLTVNPAALRAFEYAENEVIGRTVNDLFPAETARQAEAEDREIIKTGKQCTFNLETRSRSSDRCTHWEVIKTPIKQKNGQTIGVLAIARDVTLRKKNEQQLRMLSLAVEQNPNSIIISDLETRIEYVNEAFIRSTGFSLSEAVGQLAGFSRSGKTPATTYAEMRAALKEGKSWQGRFFNKNYDGDEVIIIAHISPIRNAEGRITHYLSIQEDITEREQLASEISRTRAAMEVAEAANEAKSRFLANMSHEIRTPMNAIIGLTHLLQTDLPTPRQKERLDKVSGAAEHLLGVINDILDFSKIEAGHLELSPSNFRLAEVIEKVSALVAERVAAKEVCFSTDISDLPEVVHGDAMRLIQILVNYVGNAVKFTESGSISLTGSVQEQTDDGLLARFTVTDSGIGIAAQNLPRMFEAFEQADNSTTRKYGGTGLGLRINRHLANMMGGEVGVESTPGIGSSFWVTLRLGKATASTVTPLHPIHGADTGKQLADSCSGCRILLAEDNPINQEVSLTLLHQVGISADLAADGVQAVAAASTDRYDLILMDMQMPEMDGLAATRAIRKLANHATVPIIAMTANAFDEDRRKCLNAGMNDFISKPVDPEELYARLLKWLAPVAELSAEPSPIAQAPTLPGNPAALSKSPLKMLPVLDYTLGLMQMSGNVQVYEKLLHQFAMAAERDLASLRQHLATGHTDKARRLVHTLKGSAGTLGALPLHELAASLENSISGKAIAPTIEAQFEALATAYGALAISIQNSV